MFVNFSMHRILLSILFITSLFAQDEYPYFSSMDAQLEFEENKILIKEGKEKEMIISGGGSEFNLLSLLNPYLDPSAQQPLYLNIDTETSFLYTYTFEIIHNGQIISELEFLIIIDLQDRFDKIVADYNSEVDLYNQATENNKPYEISKTEYTKKKHIIQNKAKYLTGKILKFFNWCSAGYFSYWTTYSIMQLADLPNDNKELKSHYITMSAVPTIAILSNIVMIKKINEKYKPIVINKIDNPVPQLKQTIISTQLISLSEAYNRKLYNEIREK